MPEPIVLLHGLGMSGRAWNPVIDALRSRHQVHTPTLPGHFGGLPAQRPVTIPGLTDAVEAELDAAGLHRPHLVGNSLGGWVALELARRGRARSLTAISPAGAWPGSVALVGLTAMMWTASRMAYPPTTRPWLLTPLGRQALLRGLMERGDPLSARAATAVLRDVHACTMLTEVLQIGHRDGPIHTAEDLECPVRVLWGSRDRVLPFRRFGASWLARVPSAELRILRGAGHVAMYDRPGEVAALILEHAARAETSTASR